MNVRLLRRVKKAILDEPKRLDMGDWIYTYEGGLSAPKCGTVACIAGWATLLAVGSIKDVKATAKELRRTQAIISQEGMLALGIQSFDADRLFYVDKWPEPYRTAYGTARTAQERADVTAGRIDQFIEVNK